MNLTVNHYQPHIYSRMDFNQQPFKANKTVQQGATKTATKTVLTAAMAGLLMLSDKVKTRIQTKRDIHELKTMKDNNGERRFKSIDEIDCMKAAYRIDPDSTKALAAMKDKNGNFRFNGDDLVTLVKSYWNYPDAVKKLVEMKDEDNEDNRYRQFGAGCIANLAAAYSVYPDSVEELVNMKDKDSGKYRFDTQDIRTLAEVYSKYPDSVKALAAMKKENNEYLFNSIRIAGIAEAYSKAPNYVVELAAMKDEHTCLDLISDKAIKKLVEMKFAKINGNKNE